MGSEKHIDSCLTSLIFLMFSVSCIWFSFASDALKPGESLRNLENLTSPGQIFVLQFLQWMQPDDFYLVLKYKNGIVMAWIANRDNPIKGPIRVFSLTKDGNLLISGSSGSSTTKLYSGSAARNSTLKLLDSGNLVLREGNSNNQGRILWQSFDHPVDMFIPGMKLGVNLKTQQNLLLTSWLSGLDLSPGAFTLGVDPNGTNQLFIWQRGELYWTSGVWNESSFPNVPAFVWSDIQGIGFISNEDEHYFTYSKKNGSVNSWFGIDPLGAFVRFSWSADLQHYNMQPVAFCGDKTENWSLGCALQLNSIMNCSNGDKFLSRRQAPLSPPSEVNDLSNCEAACKSNCSCTAYATAYSNGTGCYFWYGELEGYESSGEKDIYYRSLNGTGETQDKGTKRSHKLIILLAVTLPMILISFIVCYVWRKKHKKRGELFRNRQQFPFELSTNRQVFGKFKNTNNPKGDGRKDPELPIFSFAFISTATDNFSAANKLGQGGFGPVYKGKLPEGQEIAVKRLSRNSKQGLNEFKNELTLIAKVQHMNLVRLIGCCIEAEEMILIYEYMSNKSLDSFIFDRSKGVLLDWAKRVNIIEGIAQGLLYLHRYSRLKIIHRDLKASNILLDNEMNPKISDFGLARIFEQNESQANTERPAGTYGYMAPEYALQGHFSTKSDVFSFGVLLLEIVSGKKCTGLHHSMNLLGYAWELWKDDRSFELIDPLLGETSTMHKVLRCINVALLCVQETAMDRPTMSDIVLMLSNEVIALPSPKQPAFFTSTPTINAIGPTGEPISCSINDVTITEIEVR
eukprot:TRINITY_DN1294_c1_g1_i12.p1 TRINITY_DN1294_c1_g1~~TRINITY_DN1294_c1_g1_i12.p1  ORF type:complete len:798 (-),score=93.85 TRINITY_DN1294_c1_g1_i12:193-2586(-)